MSVDNKTCLVCLSQKADMVDVSAKLEDNPDSPTIVFTLEECSSLKIRRVEELCTSICADCLNALRAAFDFRKQCRSSFELLCLRLIDRKLPVPKNELPKQAAITRQHLKAMTLRSAETQGLEQTWKTSIPFVVESAPVGLLRTDFSENADIKLDSESLNDCQDIEIIAASVKTKSKYKCLQCDKEYKFQHSLKKHLSQVHTGGLHHLCNICGKFCKTDLSLKVHLLEHQENDDCPFNCEQCEQTFPSKIELKAHSFVHKQSKNKEANWLCSVCGKGFTTNQRLRIHTFVHTGEKNFSCDSCDKSFSTEFRLRCHKRIHTGERPYHCTVCGLRFAQGNALKCHRRIHTGEKPYECKVCGRCFTQNTILKTHMTLHTGKTVKCPDCDKKFSRASYLILHRREHTGEKPYACDRCPNRYRQKSHLDRHIDTHIGVKHKCQLCSKEYSKQWSLKMHLFSHTKDKPYKCVDCSMTFIRRDKYRTHMKVQHDKTMENLEYVTIIDTTDRILLDIDNEFDEEKAEPLPASEPNLCMNITEQIAIKVFEN